MLVILFCWRLCYGHKARGRYHQQYSSIGGYGLMTLGEQTTSLEKRFGRQLHILSELCEVLTLRLIELEERLSLLETNGSFENNQSSEVTRNLLEESEVKVRYLQRLLSRDDHQEDCASEVAEIPLQKEGEEMQEGLEEINSQPNTFFDDTLNNEGFEPIKSNFDESNSFKDIDADSYDLNNEDETDNELLSA